MIAELSTKADDIARVLEDEIVAGQIPPGTVLRQEQLSDRFAVSRTPVREALRRLAALGLVSFEPNRGVRVRSISPHELREAFLVRAQLESLATEVATAKMTPADIEALEEAEVNFAALTPELRRRRRRASATRRSSASGCRATTPSTRSSTASPTCHYVERVAKAARRTFIGERVWSARAELDELYARNELQHRAILGAVAAGMARLQASSHASTCSPPAG